MKGVAKNKSDATAKSMKRYEKDLKHKVSESKNASLEDTEDKNVQSSERVQLS